jgi:hypothetical protein
MMRIPDDKIHLLILVIIYVDVALLLQEYERKD